jgi:hypothetical protein
VLNSNIAVDSLPTLQISLGIIALFEKLYDGKPILPVISNIFFFYFLLYRTQSDITN